MSLEQMQRRRRAVSAIHDIVSAMRAIAAGRIQGAQRALAGARRYEEVVLRAMAAALAGSDELPFPQGRTPTLLVMTSEQPFCGAFTQNVLTLAVRRWHELGQAGPVHLIVVGQRGRRELANHGIQPDAAEPAATSLPGLRDLVKRLAAQIGQDYAAGTRGPLHVIFGRYQSISEQVPTEERILPPDLARVRPLTPARSRPFHRYLPRSELLAGLVLKYAFICLYRLAAESYASEQASRLVAMDGATRNTEKMIQTLTDLERRERQGQITRQVLELIGARFALPQSRRTTCHGATIAMSTDQATDRRILPKAKLDDLILVLQGDGFEVIGPRIDQSAIVYGPLRCADDLPIGWTDRQEPGSYRLERRGDNTYFGYAIGPHSWKKYLFPPVLRLWQARRTGATFEVAPNDTEPPPRAFLGVRACELQAIAVQDLTFLNRAGQWTDPHYARARARIFLIAVECEHPAGTCFCASMGTGPDVKSSVRFDLTLTELDDGFVVRAGSPAGEAVRDRLNLSAATPSQVEEGGRRVEQAAQSMGRSLDTTDIHDLLHRNQENPRWDQVADRCLSCTNCTLVCPTCFCSSVEDTTDLTLDTAERVRRWDSCFNPEFAQVHGGDFRPTIRGRYRQWLTHKFASWFDQFGVSGCVGCGRCITWCPVGIDVTEEITAIRATDGQRKDNHL